MARCAWPRRVKLWRVRLDHPREYRGARMRETGKHGLHRGLGRIQRWLLRTVLAWSQRGVGKLAASRHWRIDR